MMGGQGRHLQTGENISWDLKGEEELYMPRGEKILPDTGNKEHVQKPWGGAEFDVFEEQTFPSFEPL